MHRMIASGFAAICILGVASPAGAAEPLPLEGKVKFQVSYVQWVSRDVELAGASAGFGTFEFAGITRNLDGNAVFNRMTEHCTGQYYYGSENMAQTNGSCLYVDPDGDRMMVNWKSDSSYNGTKQIVGGTGKYAGITGKGTFTGTQLKAPASGMDLWLTDVELEYKMSKTAQ